MTTMTTTTTMFNLLLEDDSMERDGEAVGCGRAAPSCVVVASGSGFGDKIATTLSRNSQTLPRESLCKSNIERKCEITQKSWDKYPAKKLSHVRIYVRGLDQKICLEINGYISGYISNGQWPDRSGGARGHAPKCACAHHKI
jgi:hypothetical protein